MGAPTTPLPPNHPGHASPIPFSRTRDFEERVRQYTINLRSTFEMFLNENVQLPLWQPPLDLADGVRKHITDLKIPTLSYPEIPSLLLHNLGQPSHDPQLARRVDGLFRPEWG